MPSTAARLATVWPRIPQAARYCWLRSPMHVSTIAFFSMGFAPIPNSRGLPIEFQSELHVSSGARGGDGSETGASHGRDRGREVDLVERVEHLAAELEVTLFSDGKPFGGAEVPLLQSWSPDRVSAHRAEGSCLRREGSRIKPVRGPWIADRWRNTGDDVGANAAVASHLAVGAGRTRNRQWQAGAPTPDSINMPVAENSVHRRRRRGHHPAAAPEWQFVYPACDGIELNDVFGERLLVGEIICVLGI